MGSNLWNMRKLDTTNENNIASLSNLSSHKIHGMTLGKGIVVKKPVIEAPDIVALIVSLAATSTKHAGVYAYKYTCSARLLTWLLNRADYQIKTYKLYLIN